jgi:hypothetical protein
MPITTIISGAQTGADRAALDFGRESGFETGGFIPRGRRDENGTIPMSYENLVETTSRNFRVRTELNVRKADATLIISHGPPTGGTRLTMVFAQRYSKPYKCVDLLADDQSAILRDVRRWIDENDFRVLNVAGSRASKDPKIYDGTRSFLASVLLS